MKTRITAICIAAIVSALGAQASFAQDKTIAAAAGDKYVISARAGGVNYTEGTVGIVRKRGTSGRLFKGDTIEIGDRVSTGADGRAEILLNPGSYLRIGGESAFQFGSTALDDLLIKLDRGTSILEVFAGNEFVVTLKSPKATFKLIQSGVYRFDVAADGSGTLAVWKGKAQIGDSSASVVKAGRSAVVSGSHVAIAKFDRDENKDAFDAWSKDRAKQLAKLTDNLQKREVRNSLLTSFAGRRWNMYNSFGLWVFDRFNGGYCFLPFGNGWYSPYGYDFGHSIWWYDLPWTVYNTPPPSGPTPGGQTNPGPVNTPITSAGDRSPVPPFVRMQGGQGIGRGRDTGGGFDPSPTYSPAPTYSPPPSAPSSPTKPSELTKDGH